MCTIQLDAGIILAFGTVFVMGGLILFAVYYSREERKRARNQ